MAEPPALPPEDQKKKEKGKKEKNKKEKSKKTPKEVTPAPLKTPAPMPLAPNQAMQPLPQFPEQQPLMPPGYQANFNMMQQMYQQGPMGMMPPQLPESKGIGAAGWILIVLAIVISMVLVFGALLYSKGRLPQLERFGLPHVEVQATNTATAVVPAGTIVEQPGAQTPQQQQ